MTTQSDTMTRVAMLLSRVAVENKNFPHPYYPMAAAIINKKGKIISIGSNHMKSHPFQEKMSQNYSSEKMFLHAETDALLKAKLNVPEDAAVCVVRMGKSGMRLARPCPICMQMLKGVGINNLFYSDNDGNIVYEEI